MFRTVVDDSGVTAGPKIQQQHGTRPSKNTLAPKTLYDTLKGRFKI